MTSLFQFGPEWLQRFVDLGAVGSIASILGLVLGFLAGAGWWRVRRLIAEDREANVEALDLYETYRHLERAEQVLRKFLLDKTTSVPTKRRILDVLVGLASSRRTLNFCFFMVHNLKIAHSDSLVRIAKRHRRRKRLPLAVICYELALTNSDNGSELTEEDLRACLYGLQFCAIAMGDREEAARWAREAEARGIEGCKKEADLRRWFFFRRFFTVMQLASPDLLSRWALRRRRPRRNALRKSGGGQIP